jgi:predicted dienelactone hydrolase
MRADARERSLASSRLLQRAMLPSRRIAIALFASIACVFSAAWGDSTGQAVQLADRAVTVWEPARQDSAQVPAPVVIFSHGFHGCSIQSQFLMQALATAGYIVFAPNHRDATCNGGPAHWFEGPAEPFQSPAKWSDATYRDRADDIAAIVAALRADERCRGRIDLERLGLVGHSLGGYTVLGLSGARASWTLPGVKAVVALSPFTSPYVVQNTLHGIDVPVMYQGGTRDGAVTPVVSRSGGAYDLTPPPKYYVEFEDAGHFAWTDLRDTDHAAISAYAVAFLNRYVRGDDDPQLTQRRREVTDLRADAATDATRQAANVAPTSPDAAP